MCIGIVPSLSSSEGGVYQYALTLLDALTRLLSEQDYILFVRARDKNFFRRQTGLDSRWTWLQPLHKDRALDLLKGLIGEGRLRETLLMLRDRIDALRSLDPERIRRRPVFTRWFRRHGLDWVFYTAPNELSFEAGFPYVMPIHDLQHRLHPEFPEVSANGEWERREYLFRNGTRHATLILADSEVGKEDMLEFYGPYGVTPDRITILPFLPANYLSVDVPESERVRVRHAYRLPDRYLFYPAQFWPHKNHARIVQALGMLKKKTQSAIHVVFCGSFTGGIRKRTFQELMRLAHRLGTVHQVHYVGYVPNEDMSGLYANAVGLILPTFFGPTNIPVLEAWGFGCPVLTSDIRGIREQVGDAAMLVDPRSVEAIADGIKRLWEDPFLCQELIRRGCRKLSGYTADDFRRRLGDIIKETNERVLETNYPRT